MNLNSIENNTYYTKLKSGWFIDSEKYLNISNRHILELNSNN